MEKVRMSLAAARVNAKLTQKEAAKRLEINEATLRSYEKGLTSPNWIMIRKMENMPEF